MAITLAGHQSDSSALDHAPVPRSSLERVAQLLALALGKPALPLDAPARGTATGSGDAGTFRVHLIACAERAQATFCADSAAERHPNSTALALRPQTRAYAVVPLPIAARHGAPDDAAMSSWALCVLSDQPRAWTPAEMRALGTVASSLGGEIELRRELATERQHREDEIRQHALRDSLTGLASRGLFLDRVAHAIERGKRHKTFRFAVLSLDLDRFKAVNDSLGDDVGNEVLVAVARRLEDCVRGEDMVARLSGDEFAVLLESLADDTDGGRVAERIQTALAEPVPVQHGSAITEVFTSASIGVVLSSTGLDASSDATEGDAPSLDALWLDAPSQLLQRAAIAMTRARGSGPGRYELFDRAMHARALARLRMETDLRRAVERGEFELYYQPLISLDSGRITEVEALVRWRHPERGIVPPLDFIPLAEETGLIVPIGNWVLAEACRQAFEWQQRFGREANAASPLCLSVNLSLKQFARPGFVEHVAQVVREVGLDPRTLRLEITESFALVDAALTRGMLEELRRSGVRIYLDDFGTGYSSLGHLHKLPLDAIKIDRTFVTHMDDSPAQLQLVHTVRDLAHNIGVAAVAEGVETQQQLETLRTLGCESAQGYLFSKPVPAGQMERLLASDPRW